MKKYFFLLIAGFISLAGSSQTKWTVDQSHSTVKFTVTHLVISEVDGFFKTFDGTLTSKNPDFVDSQVDFTVDVKSVNTNNEMRDNHLKNDDFFSADKYPQMTFKSTSFKKLSGNKYELAGDLTIKGVTKRTKFDVTYGGTVKDPYGNTRAGFKAITTIKRKDFNLTWNALTEAGGAVVSDEVTIELKLEFVQEK